jgi:hypothetical protein
MNNTIKIIIATIAILLIGGAIYAIKYYDPKAPKYSKEVNTSVSDWKTYTNTKLGFEIKYPNDWKVDENTGGLDTSISIYKTNNLTGDNDAFVNRIHIDIDSSCDSSGWTISGDEIYDSFNTLNVCLDSSKSLHAELFALNDDYKTIEDLIISTFRLTSPTNTEQNRVSTSDWKSYRNKDYGVEINYPSKVSWGIYYVDGEDWFAVDNSKQAGYVDRLSVGFGTPSSKSGGLIWGLEVINKNNFDQEKYIKVIGSQFTDRQEKRENILIGSTTALLVTVTTEINKDWVSKLVIVENGDKVYLMGNGASNQEKDFQQFYKSIKFTN